ncbi:MAG: NAD-dependent epimerase/dehydratase family protein [Syntrophomonadaceae bacterium]|jgi:UDP-glucose 4-epimerase
MKNVLITGGAGFIGAYLAEALLDQGHKVVCVDNYILGKPDNVAHLIGNTNFSLYEGNVEDIETLDAIIKITRPDFIFHLAANSDIQKSSLFPSIDYQNTFATTYSVLECMRSNQIKEMFFASTSAVYGEQIGVNLNEESGNLMPISYYGGAKLASEAFISSYAYMNDFNITIFRFPNVIGPQLTHGVVFDFIKKLKNNPKQLHILGDGTQNKPYLYIHDLVEVMLAVSFSRANGINIYNIGAQGSTTVTEIADMVCARMGLKDVSYFYTEGNRGWKGDVPSFQYDLSKIHRWGWRARYSSSEAVKTALDNMKLGDV